VQAKAAAAPAPAAAAKGKESSKDKKKDKGEGGGGADKYADLGKKELRKECERRGIDISGELGEKKKRMRKALRKADKAAARGGAAGGAEDEDGGGGGGDGDDALERAEALAEAARKRKKAEKKERERLEAETKAAKAKAAKAGGSGAAAAGKKRKREDEAGGAGGGAGAAAAGASKAAAGAGGARVAAGDRPKKEHIVERLLARAQYAAMGWNAHAAVEGPGADPIGQDPNFRELPGLRGVYVGVGDEVLGELKDKRPIEPRPSYDYLVKVPSATLKELLRGAIARQLEALKAAEPHNVRLARTLQTELTQTEAFDAEKADREWKRRAGAGASAGAGAAGADGDDE